MNPKRIRFLQAGDLKKGPVVYWLSRDQRPRDHWALLFAREKARQQQEPVVVVFCLAPRFLGATLRHYAFMIQRKSWSGALPRKKP
ncbi:MAG: deoxyribodipyrimidine photo-lyase [Thermodesulfobacteriota bacterium]